ncbi:hypothetical protein DFH06DRAFT_295447 [Mycena polygramma]|nr:hypothetical protein DFH06DRAFT_295447 [Mycena polygramma]
MKSTPRPALALAQPRTRFGRNFVPPQPTRSVEIPLLALPSDVVLEILGWMSPCDLVQVRHVCRLFRSLLNAREYIWRLSRANLLLGFPLPPAANSERWFAHYILKGGPCSVCHRHTKEPPYSVSLDIRICSSACSYRLLGRHLEDVEEYLSEALVKQPSSPSFAQSLMLASKPYLEGTRDTPLYRPGFVSAALVGPNLGTMMNMAEALQDAIPRYRSKKRVVEAKNRACVARFASEAGLTYDHITVSPTLARYFHVFSRDLTEFSDSVWKTIRDVCLAEVALRIPPDNRCPFCSESASDRRCFKTENRLRQHLQLEHPEEYGSIPSAALHPCTACPPSERVFRFKQLKRHIKAKHTEPVSL